MKTTTRRGANHGLHVVLTFMTCGLWAITGWPIAAAMGRKTTVTVAAPQATPWRPAPAPGGWCPPCWNYNMPNHEPGRCPLARG